MQNPCLDGLTSWLCFGTEKSLCLVDGDVLPEALRGERGAARQSFGGVPDMWMIERDPAVWEVARTARDSAMIQRTYHVGP